MEYRMTSPRSWSVAAKVVTTVPTGADRETVFSELNPLNTGVQSFSSVSVTVTCPHVTGRLIRLSTNQVSLFQALKT